MPRVALIGYGQIAQSTHQPALMAAGCELVAVVEPDPTRRAAAAAALPEVVVVDRLAALWARAPRLDFVDICTPPAVHLEALTAAWRHGVGALCEKPLVLDGGEMAALAAMGAGETWAVGYVHNWLCAPAVATMVDWVRAGRIGPPTHIEAVCLRTRPAAGAADGAHPWRQVRASAGGGILMDHGWHGLGILLRLAGERPCRLTSHLEMGALGLEHTAEVRLAFATGAEGRFFATWGAARRHNRIVARGPGGEIVLADDQLTLCRPGVPAEHARFAESLADGGYRVGWTRAAIAAYLPQLTQPAARRTSFAEATEIVRIIDAAYAQADRRAATSPVGQTSLARQASAPPA